MTRSTDGSWCFWSLFSVVGNAWIKTWSKDWCRLLCLIRVNLVLLYRLLISICAQGYWHKWLFSLKIKLMRWSRQSERERLKQKRWCSLTWWCKKFDLDRTGESCCFLPTRSNFHATDCSKEVVVPHMKLWRDAACLCSIQVILCVHVEVKSLS